MRSNCVQLKASPAAEATAEVNRYKLMTSDFIFFGLLDQMSQRPTTKKEKNTLRFRERVLETSDGCKNFRKCNQDVSK